VLDALAAACGDVLLDVHADPDHHRSVLTLGGPAGAVESAARSLARTAVTLLDLSGHDGVHPRLGVIDVVPFVPLPPAPPVTGSPSRPTLGGAVVARDAFARWAADELGLPCFAYGPLPGGGERSLPEVRRRAFADLAPDKGPAAPHPTAGAAAVGARGVLVAYNLWVDRGTVALARSVAAAVRGPAVRALGLELAHGVQVSCNLVQPFAVGPAEVRDAVATLLEQSGARVARCELVGLVPAAVLERTPLERRDELGLDQGATIEGRLSAPLEARPLS
jgi:glutamate formiminotransferase / 5-formyltetrahydrofolate cyclo-ligase